MSAEDALLLPAPIDFAGLPIRPLRREQLISTLVARARRGVRTCVHYVNAHTFNLSRRNAEYTRALAECDLLYADGKSVVWAARLLGQPLPERLSAADFIEDFCRACAVADVSLFLLGGEEGIAERAAETLRKTVPRLRIAGTHTGYFEPADSGRVIDAINASDAHVLLAGMGSPRQELWLAEHGAELRPPVRWAVGALLDYPAGAERRCPVWAARCGAEWGYRMLQRPRQRWKRYLLGNPAFCWRILKERMSFPTGKTAERASTERVEG
jgi:N-acetylglucosaminyldiphosphoundecaprenol N-acetyl-beta-D-mannosaminyltransferase